MKYLLLSIAVDKVVLLLLFSNSKYCSFIYFSTITYVMSTHLKCPAEVFPMSTHSILPWRNKKKIYLSTYPSDL